MLMHNLKSFSMYHRVPEEYQGTFQATRPFNDKRASWRPMRRASGAIQVRLTKIKFGLIMTRMSFVYCEPAITTKF